MNKLILIAVIPPHPDSSFVGAFEGDRPDYLKHEGVALVSKNVLLFEKPKAYVPHQEACANLRQRNWPYLEFDISTAERAEVGTLSEEVTRILSAFP